MTYLVAVGKSDGRANGNDRDLGHELLVLLVYRDQSRRRDGARGPAPQIDHGVGQGPPARVDDADADIGGARRSQHEQRNQEQQTVATTHQGCAPPPEGRSTISRAMGARRDTSSLRAAIPTPARRSEPCSNSVNAKNSAWDIRWPA